LFDSIQNVISLSLFASKKAVPKDNYSFTIEPQKNSTFLLSLRTNFCLPNDANFSLEVNPNLASSINIRYELINPNMDQKLQQFCPSADDNKALFSSIDSAQNTIYPFLTIGISGFGSINLQSVSASVIFSLLKYMNISYPSNLMNVFESQKAKKGIDILLKTLNFPKKKKTTLYRRTVAFEPFFSQFLFGIVVLWIY